MRYPRFSLVEHPAFLFVLTAGLLVVARVALYLVSPRAQALPTGEWSNKALCSLPLCLVTPDSARYAAMTTAARHSGLLRDPFLAISQLAVFETHLGAVRDGVVFSYIGAWVSWISGLSAYNSDAVLEFVGAIMAVFVLGALFRYFAIGQSWFLAALCSPIFLYYGNMVMKDSWDVALLLGLVYAVLNVDRRQAIQWILTITLVYMLYFDRGYYVFLGLVVAAGDRVARVRVLSRRRFRYLSLALLLAGLLSISGHRYVVAAGPGGPGLSALISGLPHTLLAPIGLHNIAEALLFIMSISVFITYLVVAVRTLEWSGTEGTDVANSWARRSSIWLLTFMGALVWATRAEGAGFERGRDALAPFLFIGAGMLSSACLLSRAEGNKERRGPLNIGSHLEGHLRL